MRIEEYGKWALPAAVGAVSFVAGAAVGYFATKRQYDRIEEEIAEVEAEQLQLDFEVSEVSREINKAIYTLREMRNESKRLMSGIRDIALVKNLPVESSMANHPAVTSKDPRNIRTKDQEPDQPASEEVIHIFATNADPNWDYEKELASRTPDKPYVLHRDEFFNDEMSIQEDHHHDTLTYYAGDGILVTGGDIPIYDIEGTIGPLMFGHGSGDPTVFYVRNEEQEAEFEVILDEGYYQETVLGETVEREAERQDLRHHRRPGKFRYE